MTLTGPGVPTPMSIKLDPGSSMVDMFSAVRNDPYPVLLDSALTSPNLGRFSYLTSDPFLVLRSKGRRVEIESAGSLRRLDANPFTVLKDLLGRFSLQPVPGLPPFQGGVMGYFSYELAHHLEILPYQAIDDLRLPEMTIGFYDWAISRDHVTGDTWAMATGLPEGSGTAASRRLDWVRERVHQAPPYASSTGPESWANGLESNFSRDAYLRVVETVKKYIAEGDIYQANISQRFAAPISCEPWDLYLRLREVSPAPFAAYLGYPEVTVLSASPEEFLRLSKGTVQTRPMKGTCPRGSDPVEDRRMAAELLASEKERAENIMIVDLMRNDLGKVCIPGSIEVPELFAVEKYPTVYQMVSTVKGKPLTGVDAVDILAACFPGGSVTGAPKIRAIEIIDELEPTQRSVYCGAIGYIGFDGSMLTSIPIRTLLVKGETAYFQVGGGIVADSTPEAEYEETLDKARGSLAALGVRLTGC